jgi:hypothetical protein
MKGRKEVRKEGRMEGRNARLFCCHKIWVQPPPPPPPRWCLTGDWQSAKLYLQSSELGLPHPLSRRRVHPPLWFFGSVGEDTHACGRGGWGSPKSDEGTCTVVLYIYKYFVVVQRIFPD